MRYFSCVKNHVLSNICAILTFAIKFHSVVGQWTLTLRQIFSDKTIIGHNKVRGFPRKHLEPKILKESTFPYFPGLSTHLYFGLFVGPGLGACRCFLLLHLFLFIFPMVVVGEGRSFLILLCFIF